MRVVRGSRALAMEIRCLATTNAAGSVRSTSNFFSAPSNASTRISASVARNPLPPSSIACTPPSARVARYGIQPHATYHQMLKYAPSGTAALRPRQAPSRASTLDTWAACQVPRPLAVGMPRSLSAAAMPASDVTDSGSSDEQDCYKSRITSR